MKQSTDDRTTVLIVEDHPIFREALEGYIKTQPDQFHLLDSAATAGEGLARVESQPPDIVLLDLGLPHVTEDGVEEGLALIRQVHASSPVETKIIVLTAFRPFEVIFKAIQAGAMAYLLKENVTGDDLLLSLSQVRDGEPPIDQEIARKMWAYFQRPVPDDLPPIREKLTPREEEVVQLISQGCSNAQIAGTLHISEKTVKKHVSNMLAKLQLDSRKELRFYYQTSKSLDTGSSSAPPKALAV